MEGQEKMANKERKIRLRSYRCAGEHSEGREVASNRQKRIRFQNYASDISNAHQYMIICIKFEIDAQ